MQFEPARPVFTDNGALQTRLANIERELAIVKRALMYMELNQSTQPTELPPPGRVYFFLDYDDVANTTAVKVLFHTGAVQTIAAI